MKAFVSKKFFFVLLLIFSISHVHAQEPLPQGHDQPFAVVELFTSQGCSSCPPADQILSSVTHFARENNARIFTLSFHVDYWNYLGWRDPFSSAENTDRQRSYAKALRSSNVYTPQMIVNGKHGFSGNNHPQLLKYIDAAMGEAPSITFESLKIQHRANDKLEISYTLSFERESMVLNVALVERGLFNNVGRGENSGKQLAHDNVVRAFRSMDVEKNAGSIILKKPKTVNLEKSSIIAYVQNSTNLAVLGAISLDIPSR